MPHLESLRLQGLQPKTIDAYARAVGHLGEYFHYHIDDLTEAQLIDYFTDRLHSHSGSTVGPCTKALVYLAATVIAASSVGRWQTRTLSGADFLWQPGPISDRNG